MNKPIVLLLTLLLVSSCGAKERSVTPAATDAAQESQALKVANRTDAAPSAPRMIVRSAEMRVIVGDTSKAVTEATRAVEAVGGYVAGSHIWREGELLRARITLRVPSDKLTVALAQIRATAKRVENETISSEDVSAEYVDLGARVRNLEATEEELRQLLVVARQNSRKATDVLEVHQQLTLIRGEIEQAKGRMRYLSETAAMSSIALDITPDALAQPVVQPGWQPLVVAKDAARALVALMQGVANAAIWIVIYLLPVGALLALLAFGMWRAAWRITARNAASAEPTAS
ncbi:MAG TPA: DUF4349 domain-containing protein [Thermoanaerobaculia bacterium]